MTRKARAGLIGALVFAVLMAPVGYVVGVASVPPARTEAADEPDA